MSMKKKLGKTVASKKAATKKSLAKKAPAKKSVAKKQPRLELPELPVTVSLQSDGYLSVKPLIAKVREPTTIVLSLDGSLPNATFLSQRSRRKGFEWKSGPSVNYFGLPAPGAQPRQLQVVDYHADIDVEWHYRLAVRWNNKTYYTDLPPTGAGGAKPSDRPGTDPIIINKKAKRKK